ncbi:hypothetical protein [Azospirillum halopraeferens]|uniref:hypothetical protein n=1 Tax=Azospirillum halopraeferens TaxID=34010 RepID=UPI00041D9684|nr:hypothetical protein [Azospirillum halopraeferens]
MESTGDTLTALVLLVLAVGAIVGSLLIDPALTVWLVVLLTAINGAILVKLTLLSRKE